GIARPGPHCEAQPTTTTACPAQIVCQGETLRIQCLCVACNFWPQTDKRANSRRGQLPSIRRLMPVWAPRLKTWEVLGSSDLSPLRNLALFFRIPYSSRAVATELSML